MITVYAEKFDVGLKIAAALTGGFEYRGRSVRMANIESVKKTLAPDMKKDRCIRIRWKDEDVAVTWGQGHMCELKQARDYDPAYEKWQNLPVPFIPETYEIKIREGVDRQTHKKNGQADPWTSAQLKKIGELFEASEYIINATDDDREGELIFAYVYEILHCRKPYKRVLLDSQTEEGFRKAFSRLLDSRETQNIEAAGRTRAIADWVVGANLSAQMTLHYGRYMPRIPMITVGRIQTPVLDMIVEREKKIRDFRPEDYWYITAVFTTEGGKTYRGRHTCEKIPSLKQAQALMDRVSGQPGCVKSNEVKEVRREVPLLYSLPDLSRAANEAFGLTAKETLQTAQELYEAGYITYPRTESQCLTEDMKKDVDEVLDLLCGYSEVYEKWIRSVPNRKHTKRHYDTSRVDSHFAIIPTNQIPAGLSGAQADLYDLIARSLIRTIYGPAVEQKSTMITEAAGEEFKTTGTIIKDAQWLALEMKPRKDELLPPLSSGEEVECAPEMKHDKTKPPKRYTDATLLLAMQTASKSIDDDELREILKETNRGGIGRPSTQGPVIETVVNRYCTREKKYIVPTEEGMKLIEILPVASLKSPEMTARWEQHLDEVAKGERTMEQMINDIEKMVTESCEQIQSDQRKIQTVQGTSGDMKCPVCGGALVKRKFGWMCENYTKDGDGCSFAVSAEIAGAAITEEQVKKLVETGRTDYIRGFHRKDTKETFGSYLAVQQGKVVFSRQTGQTCPHCGKPLNRTDKGIWCSGREDGCRFAVWNEIAHKKLTEKQKEQLVKNGKTGVIKGFRAKSGSVFDMALRVNKETGQVEFDVEKPVTDESLRCPVCGAVMEKTSRFVRCTDEDCGVRIQTEIAHRPLKEAELRQLLSEKRTGVLSGFTARSGKKFDAALYLDDEASVQFEFQKGELDESLHCPVCSAPLVKDAKIWKCSSDACSFRLFTTMWGRKMEETELRSLVELGLTDKLDGFVSAKTGKKYSAKIALRDGKAVLELDGKKG